MKILSIFNLYERYAQKHLKKQGLKLIARNYLCRYGEIDLIMSDKESLVFIEVRYRKKADYGNALESVTKSKQQKITKTAQHFLLTYPQWENHPLRFDVFAITGKEIDWVKAAF